jgi:membrane-bound lytic murein transglycosylase
MMVCRQRETIMEQLTPDDRIAVQEKALDAVNCELALLRQHMDARFTGLQASTDAQFASMQASTDARFASMQASTDTQFASMRQYVDDGFVKLRLEMQLHTNQAVAAAVAQLSAKIDKSTHWTIGLLISGLIGMIALAARGLL